MRAKADLGVRGAIHPPSGANPVPLSAALHALYDGATNKITLNNSIVRTPAATVTADGTVGERGNNLRLVANTRDVHDLVLLASAFQAPSQTPSKPLEISGPASLNATVTGTTANPQVAAQLSAQNLQVQGTRWSTLQLNAHANPSGIQVQNGNLVNARQGDIRFSGTVGLHKWAYTPESPITADATVRQMPVSELQQLAAVNYPVSGVLAADITLHGTQLDPVGHGSVQLLHATAYEQPVQNLSATFQAANGIINSQLDVKVPAGAAKGTLAFTPRTKAYQLQFDAPGIVLQDLQALQAKNLAINGKLTATASGQGTLDNPNLQATLQIPQLQMKQTTVTGVRADLSVANHKAVFTLGSDLGQSSIRAKGSIDLTGGYYTNATLDTTKIPLDPLLAAYVSALPNGASSEIELHATVKGPIKDKSQVEAHLTIPTFNAEYQQVKIANNGPIKVDYANSIVTIQPSELQGTDSSLRFQGKVPLENGQAIDVTAKGNVNLKLLHIFVPDATTAGMVLLDVRGSGNSVKPDVQGQVQLQKVAFIPSGAPLGVENVNGVLDIANGRIQIKQLTGQSGGGDLSVGGFMVYEPSPHFDLLINAKSVRLLYPGLRTVLDGDLTASGSTAASSLNGRVLIDSISFTPEFDLATFISSSGTPSVPSARPSPADNMKLNIAVQSTSDLAASSSTVSLQGSANLRVIGTASDPVIVGRADLNSGDVFFNQQRFVLERGIVNFINPHHTEPNVNVLITTTVQQYNLSLTILGPVDKLTTSYTSDPPLPPVDIINLIARGQTTEQPTT
ncbi:MAG: translocation/assembly module TamB domain-containing protein, partial [Acidobacteriales bacterium]|nr:translocation/assembly module TamB domain-containing protein [Terriglobales bacterium]